MLQSTLYVLRIVVTSGVVAAALLYLFPTVSTLASLY
jgi:hypothetical protein